MSILRSEGQAAVRGERTPWAHPVSSTRRWHVYWSMASGLAAHAPAESPARRLLIIGNSVSMSPATGVEAYWLATSDGERLGKAEDVQNASFKVDAPFQPDYWFDESHMQPAGAKALAPRLARIIAGQ